MQILYDPKADALKIQANSNEPVSISYEAASAIAQIHQVQALESIAQEMIRLANAVETLDNTIAGK